MNPQLATAVHSIVTTYILVGLVLVITAIVGFAAGRKWGGTSRPKRQAIFGLVTIVGVVVLFVILQMRR